VKIFLGFFKIQSKEVWNKTQFLKHHLRYAVGRRAKILGALRLSGVPGSKLSVVLSLHGYLQGYPREYPWFFKDIHKVTSRVISMLARVIREEHPWFHGQCSKDNVGEQHGSSCCRCPNGRSTDRSRDLLSVEFLTWPTLPL